jgi:hypothetical protein
MQENKKYNGGKEGFKFGLQVKEGFKLDGFTLFHLGVVINFI